MSFPGHRQEPGGLDDKLKGIRLLPYFFTQPPPGNQFYEIDAYPFVDCLRQLTEMVERGLDSRQIFDSGGPTRLVDVLLCTHVASFSEPRLANEGNLAHGPYCFRSSWPGAAAAAGLYLHTVLGIWNAGDPIDRLLHHRVLLILKRDIEAREKMGHRCIGQFWKMFLGALSVARSLPMVRDDSQDTDMLPELYAWYCGSLERWCKRERVIWWTSARAVLRQVVWPVASCHEPLAEALWKDATKST